MKRVFKIALFLTVPLLVCACSITRKLDKTKGKPDVTFDIKKDIEIPNKTKAYLRLLEKQQNNQLSRKEEKQLIVYDSEYDSVEKAKLMVIKLKDVTVHPTLKVLPERSGEINLGFMVDVPDSILNKGWEIVLEPKMQKGDNVHSLEKVVLKGSDFSRVQEKRISAYNDRVDGIKNLGHNYNRTYSDEAYAKRMERLYGISATAENRAIYDVDGNIIYCYSNGYTNIDTITKRGVMLKDRAVLFSQKRYNKLLQRKEIFDKKEKPSLGAEPSFYNALDDRRLTKQVVISNGIITKSDALNNNLYASYAKTLSKKEAISKDNARSVDYLMSKMENKRNLRKQPNLRLDSIVSSKGGARYYYSQKTSTQEDFDKYIYVSVDSYLRDRRGNTLRLPTSDTLKFKISSMDNFIDYTPHYVYRIVERVAYLNDQVSIIFPVGKTNIIDTLHNNKAELTKLVNVMDKLLNSDEYVVDSIIFTAKSSPEGPVSLNNMLAKGRAESLNKYIIAKYGNKAKGLITPRSIGEDWAGLIDYITEDNKLTNKSEIFKMISKYKNLDKREYALKRYLPKERAYMLDSIYPKLRVIDFNYFMHRKGMVKDTVHTTEIDEVYVEGVKALEAHDYRKAIKIFVPYGEDFNRGIALMSLGFNKSALRIFEKNSISGHGEYLKAIIYSRLEKYLEAYEHYRKACDIMPSLIQRGNLDPEIQNMLNNAAVAILKKEDDAISPLTIEDEYYYNDPAVPYL